ncbi:cytochrome c oxidase subunit II [Allobranchiibius sp. GilTou73]|uniref:aa3-type cytochrome oxidase subunit II n=1 Tax=Allobranchiibius sp. GilTou73 TaxID=2904523 RepID=UPI001F19AD39|nr:cytochrome c oxidase subunit II [Allobranchiibius sp. GilTou73]UIJ33588.1 cytochrome c oxidase subunit II [Allobranchiibius sp. GilTou73]
MSGTRENQSGGTPRRPVKARSLRRRLGYAGVVAICATALSGCTAQQRRGFLPHGITKVSPDITHFWVASWLWALGVGVLVWGLIIYCAVRYRRKKTDTGLPPQLAYNVPIEILYTVVPVIMVAVLFGKTVQLENKMLDTSGTPQNTVNVIGKQWSWDFNYVNDKVYDTGEQALLNGKPGAEKTIPTLYLPVNERTEFILTSRDVIHDFWVIAFLQKMDMIPGKVNKFDVTPTQIGTYRGKCAELCGAYHSQMLFNVKVVDAADYAKQMQRLRAAGQTGFLSNALNRSGLENGQQQYLPSGLDSSDVVNVGSK